MQYAAGQSVTVTLKPQTTAQEAVDAVLGEIGEASNYDTAVLGWEWTQDSSDNTGDAPDQLEMILGGQGGNAGSALQWLLDYPIAPSTVDGLQYYRDSPDYVVTRDPDFVADIFHPEAHTAYRIYRNGQISGNQALYDAEGNLVGTSVDWVSPEAGRAGLVVHQLTDTLSYAANNPEDVARNLVRAILSRT